MLISERVPARRPDFETAINANHMNTCRFEGSDDDGYEKFNGVLNGEYESQKNVNPDRADGTCNWVLKHPQYHKWLDNPNDDLLWISADPGCGKSVLSKSLIDCDLAESQEHTVCYFFFKDNENQDSLAIALRALIHQLFAGQLELVKHALPSWERDGDKVQREVDELWRIRLGASRSQHFVSFVSTLTCMIIDDGLEGQVDNKYKTARLIEGENPVCLSHLD
ncbi:MAG: hypothetical protein M1812_005797 [Candelaria pacifica]|nr:MAG: hypothetical protein M1812_005797 [Candelaria pacifica]